MNGDDTDGELNLFISPSIPEVRFVCRGPFELVDMNEGEFETIEGVRETIEGVRKTFEGALESFEDTRDISERADDILLWFEEFAKLRCDGLIIGAGVAPTDDGDIDIGLTDLEDPDRMETLSSVRLLEVNLKRSGVMTFVLQIRANYFDDENECLREKLTCTPSSNDFEFRVRPICAP